MSNNKVGELVKLAKGEDRKLKEYAEASGVDASIISKIIKGTYIPKKAKLYRDLTSEKADPRGGVTFEQLMEASKISTSYAAGLAATEAALAVIGGLPVGMMLGGAAIGKASLGATTKKKTDKKVNVDNMIIEMQKYVDIATGRIIRQMMQNDIVFKLGKNDQYTENQFDACFRLENQNIQQYIFRYVYLSEQEKKNKFLLENTSKRIVEELMFWVPDSTRKVSIVMNCNEAYEFLLSFKNKISYQGNLSIILVEEEKSGIDKEDYISRYNLEDESKLLYIV